MKALKVILFPFNLTLIGIRINPNEKTSFYEALIHLSKYLNQIDSIRIANCTPNEMITNTCVKILNNNESVSCLELYNCEFIQNSFEVISKSLINCSLQTIHLDKISYNQDSFAFFITCLNRNDTIHSLTLKRLDLPFECSEHFDKLLIENQHLKFLEITFSKNNANKSQIYSQILETLSENTILENVKLEDHHMEKEDIAKLQKIYESRQDGNKINIQLNYNLTNTYLLNVLEIYLKHNPKLNQVFRISFQDYNITYNEECVAELELKSFNGFEDCFTKYITRYNIRKIIFKLEKYEHVRNFFTSLKEKDYFTEMVVRNLNEENIFLDFLSEFLYTTKNLEKIYLDSNINLMRVEKTILLAIQNNRYINTSLVMKGLDIEEIEGIAKYLGGRKENFQINNLHQKRIASSKGVTLVKMGDHTQKLVMDFI